MTLALVPPETGFLGLSGEDAGAPESARAVVIPFGLEATVSYGRGTARGPQAILAASPELEFFDDELWCEPFREIGIATLKPPAIPSRVEAALSVLEQAVEMVLAAGKFPLVLGGEHSLTVGTVRPFVRRFSDLAVLHLDAHADLRDAYLGERFSHACTMRRVLEHPGLRAVSVGIRAISAEEVPFLEASSGRIHVHWARESSRWRLDEIVAPLRGRPIYVTVDVDVLDCGLMPATGTPEPGGLSFAQVCTVLRAAAEAGCIVGADIVELAPIPGLHACDFTAAKLAYKLLAYAFLAKRPDGPKCG